MTIRRLMRRAAAAAFTLRGAGKTSSARYCYAVWLRHLVLAGKAGLSVQPDTVAELGPGDSLGIGLAALLSGVNSYYALDIVEYASNKRNLEVLEQLVALFAGRERIPDETEFPDVKPYLQSYDFPHHILSEQRLRAALQEERVAQVRCALEGSRSGAQTRVKLSYVVPWYDPACIEGESVDMIYSQAVLEHVDQLDHTYQQLYRWLRPGGFMSHQIDFRCHGTAVKWNGHWAYSERVWNFVSGVWPYLLNREPCFRHIELLQRTGMQVVCQVRVTRPSGIRREQLAPRFKDISDDDLTTSGAFIQALKRP